MTDVLFALDSIPAIYGLTQDPYIVFTANAFALMGLRQLYFLIGGLLKKLVHLCYGLSVILGFIGVKLVLHALHRVGRARAGFRIPFSLSCHRAGAGRHHDHGLRASKRQEARGRGGREGQERRRGRRGDRERQQLIPGCLSAAQGPTGSGRGGTAQAVHPGRCPFTGGGPARATSPAHATRAAVVPSPSVVSLPWPG
ncbi:hypothetical protein SMICM304S_09177 [Streptomyces microflavus]